MDNNLDNFKSFVKIHPNFANYIKDGSMTWQKFYELYDMYGADSSIWDNFDNKDKTSPTISDIVNALKNIDLNKLQDGVNSLSKAVGLFSDLFSSNKEDDIYKPRAIYQRFED